MADPGSAGSPFPGWLGSGELVREADIINLGVGPFGAGPDCGAAGSGPAEGMATMAQQTALGFAGLLRQLRTEAKLTQEELARAAGLSPRSVSDLERGVNRTAHKDTAELLAGALGLAEPARAVFVAAARGRAPAADVLTAVRRAADAAASDGPAASGDLVWSGCPYLGLVPFEERDARVFYGRGELADQLVRRLAERLDGTGMLLVAGESGRASPRCCGLD